jgi:hypothetical protein
MRTLSSLMRTRENIPDGHPSQIAPSQARLTWRSLQDRLLKKKMHLVGMDTLLILLSLGLGYNHPRGQDITIHPLRRPTFSSVNPNPGTSPLDHVCMSSVIICHVMWPLRAHMRHAPYTRTPNPHTSVKPRGLALIPLVTPHSTLGPTILTSGSFLGSYIVPTDQHKAIVRTLSSCAPEKTFWSVTHPKLLHAKHA